MLRDYQDDRQIGWEDTPEEFIANLLKVFNEVNRILKPDGTLWLNIGDSYAGSGKSGATKEARKKHTQFSKKEIPSRQVGPTKCTGKLKPKDMIGIPWMLAFALRDSGWHLRSDIIWHKHSPTPERVGDRPSKAYEHISILQA